MPKHVVILGAGISGLACAWSLKKTQGKNVHVTILEKSSRVGGWIQSTLHDGFLFEQGPRSCRPKGHGFETLQWVEELGLQNQVIVGDPAASKRFLYINKKLHSLPHSLGSLLFSPLMQGVWGALWKELRTPRSHLEDESIDRFFERRLGRTVADRFIDPFVSGIYAGDSRRLSLKSCFPQLYAWEQQAGSLIKGAWKHQKKPSSSLWTESIRKYPVFSFKKGLETLPQEAAHQLDGEIRLNAEVIRLIPNPDGISLILADQRVIHAEEVISALPASVIASLLHPYGLSFTIPHASITVVSLGYRQPILPEKGFGYLIPSKEKEKILGCVWDSYVFPQQNQFSNETRLTVMLGGIQHPWVESLDDHECLKIAKEALAQHLNINAEPDAVLIKRAYQAIPQYEVGYAEQMKQLHIHLSQHLPRLSLIGHAFNGVAVNDCVASARQTIFRRHLN